MRRLVVAAGALLLAAVGTASYFYFFREPPALAQRPEFKDPGKDLPTPEEFEALAHTDPVKLLSVCLTRYQREVKHGLTATLFKKERVLGEPRPPKEPPQEEIQLSVLGEVPDDAAKGKAHVRMVWVKGARSVLFSEVRGTLFVEEKGGNKDEIVVLRPKAPFKTESHVAVNGTDAKGASRYCIKDAGLYGAMLRSHTVWKKRQDDHDLHWRFVEKRPVPEVGGRVCYVIERTCPSPEVDPFEIGGEPNTGGKPAAEVGQVRVTIFIDAERWLQAGSELHRADGHLLGSYYFRDINLNPTFTDETFTVAGLKKAVAEVMK